MSQTAKDYMSRKFVRLSPDMDVLEAVGQLITHRTSGGFVVDRLGNLVGVLSEIDCMRAAIQAAYHGSRGGRVSEFMRTDTETVDIDEGIMDIAKRFVERDFYYYRGFPVMKNNRVVGRIILRDVLRALQEMSREEG